MTVGVKKVPKWESELWGYLSGARGALCIVVASTGLAVAGALMTV